MIGEAKDLTQAALIKTEINRVYGQIVLATDHVPDRVRNGSYQAAIKWKDVAKKWRAAAEKGAPAHNTVEKLEVLLGNAKQALEQIKTGAV